jgi:hypothetical protein
MAENETTYNQVCEASSPGACKPPGTKLTEKEGELAMLNGSISTVEEDLGKKKQKKQHLEEDIKRLQKQKTEVDTAVNEYAEKLEEIKKDKDDLKCFYDNRKTVLENSLSQDNRCKVICFRNLVDRAIAILKQKAKNGECIAEKTKDDHDKAVNAKNAAVDCYNSLLKKKDTLLVELANSNTLKGKIEKPGGPGGNDETKNRKKSYFYTLELGKVLCEDSADITDYCKTLIQEKKCVSESQPLGLPDQCEKQTTLTCEEGCKLTIIEPRPPQTSPDDKGNLESKLHNALCTIQEKLDAERVAQNELTKATAERDALKVEYEDKKKKRDEIIIKWIVGELASDIINRIKELNFPSQQ